MKILIVEDDRNKERNIYGFIQKSFPESQIQIGRSYQSGLSHILKNRYDLVILDMSLPTYDITPTEDGYTFRYFGGKDILSEMKRKKRTMKTVVLTQFDIIGEGDNTLTLDELRSELVINYSDIYLDTIYYNASETTWQETLKSIIERVNNS